MQTESKSFNQVSLKIQRPMSVPEENNHIKYLNERGPPQ